MEEDVKPEELRAFPVGRIVDGRYQVLDHVGHGGMGMVLKCKDITLDDEICVLKILYPRLISEGVSFSRFKREVIISRRLSHPNIVKIYDFGQADEETFYISMEYIEGESLKESLDRFSPRGLPLDKVIYFLFKVAEGLAYSHSLGIIHRDIKPANILIGRDYEVKITDLGVARGAESAEKLTATDETVGSPIYMAPEQLNSNTFDSRSDIYAFGIMAYELLTGQAPFYSEHWVKLVKMHMHDPIPGFASKENKIPLWVEELVEKCCEKNPEDRFQNANEVLRFLCNHYNCKEWISGTAGLQQQTSSNLIVNSMIASAVLLLSGLVGFLAFS